MTDNRARYGLIVDGLNSASVTRDQFERTLVGGITAMNLTIIHPVSDFDFATSMASLDRELRIIEGLGDIAVVARSVADIEQARAESRVAVIMGTQNCAFIENDLSLLGFIHRLGFRILQLTYNERNRLGDGSTVPVDQGLTDLGRECVQEMNRLGIVIDLSHCSYRTSADAIKESKQPVIFSHANALTLCNSPRNKPDELIRAVAEKGGVTAPTCWPPLIKHESRPTIADYLDHVDYIVNLAGIDHVGFSTDMSEGKHSSAEVWDKRTGPNGKYPTVTGMLGHWFTFDKRFVDGLDGIQDVPRVWDGLLERGYSEDAIEKIMGRNLLRVFRDVWGR